MRRWSELPGCSLTNWVDIEGFFWDMRRLLSIPAGPPHCSFHSRHSLMNHPGIQILTVLNCSLICHCPELCVSASVSELTLSQTLFLTGSFSDWTYLHYSPWGPGPFRHGPARFRIDPCLCFRQNYKLTADYFSHSALFAQLLVISPDAEITLFYVCSSLYTRRGLLCDWRVACRERCRSRVACVTAWEKLTNRFPAPAGPPSPLRQRGFAQLSGGITPPLIRQSESLPETLEQCFLCWDK